MVISRVYIKHAGRWSSECYMHDRLNILFSATFEVIVITQCNKSQQIIFEIKSNSCNMFRGQFYVPATKFYFKHIMTRDEC